MPTNGAASITTSGSRPMPKPKTPLPLDAALRKAIKSSGATHYVIAQVAGVAPSMIDRFMLPADDPRHRDIRLATAAKLASAMGLELVAAELQ